jgi:glycosyltransferase involved in cell wall biosynthesis
LDGGEALYKGFELLQQLAPRLRAAIGGLRLDYCGKISPAQAQCLRDEGWQVHVGVSDAERNRWLRSCHAVVSPSLWEGFNLPLVEAQALGTVALAFDTGSHPEVTPFVCGGLGEMEGLLLALDHDRDLLTRYSAEAYDFVRRRFDWDKAADALALLLAGVLPRFRTR